MPTAQTTAQTTALSPEEASARWVCRQSGDTLTYNAAMNDAQHTLLTCMPLRIEARMSDNTIVRLETPGQTLLPDLTSHTR